MKPRNTRRPAAAPARGALPRRERAPLRARLAAWRDQHFYGLLSSLGRLATRPWATLLTVLVLGFAFALPLLFFLVQDNVRALSSGLREARDVTVFLQPGLPADAAGALAGELRARTDVVAVVERTPEQGLDEFRRLSGFGEALDALGGNPLPAVLVVTPRLAPAAVEPPVLAALAADARVDLVQYDAAWRRKLSHLLAFGERAVAVMALLLALASLLVVGNTVRMDVRARAEEISVMQLIGASDRFVRRPFLYAGLWYGLLGGLAALLIVALVEWSVAPPLERLLADFGHAATPRGLGLVPAAGLVGAAMLLGWAGARLATARRLAAGRPRA